MNEADIICELLADEVGVIDVLGMTKMPRNAMLEILNNKQVARCRSRAGSRGVHCVPSARRWIAR